MPKKEGVNLDRKAIGRYTLVDEENHLITLRPDGKEKNEIIVDFNDILGYELVEDSNTVTKGGLGRAVTGGILFGGVGAIVGGVTGKKKTREKVRRIEVFVRLRDGSNVILKILNVEVKKSSLTYTVSMRQAQEVITVLTGIIDSNSSTQLAATSAADEIRKMKALLDDGILTENEFLEKKKQLLGL